MLTQSAQNSSSSIPSEIFSEKYVVPDWKKDFPMLQGTYNGGSLHYLDSAATSQKPLSVIEAMQNFYQNEYGTVRRGVYLLSAAATALYEKTRAKIAHFIGASSSQEIVYTSGATQSLNLIAFAYGRTFIKAGQEILVSEMEHHANITPWQMVCEETGAKLKVIPVNDEGEIDLEAYERLLNKKTALVAITHVSNVLGTINPIKKMAALAHMVGAVVVVDVAQAVAHVPVDVVDIDADFYAFSGHKLYGPTGIGVLYGKFNVLEKMPPYQRGGDMIETVDFSRTTYQSPPHRFEAGTPPIAEVIGLSAALDYLKNAGLEAIEKYEQRVLHYGTKVLQAIDGLEIIGTSGQKSGIISFVLDGAHPHDIGTMLDEMHVAVRAGHHCAQPLMKRFGVSATVRASIGIYTVQEDWKALEQGLRRTKEVFS